MDKVFKSTNTQMKKLRARGMNIEGSRSKRMHPLYYLPPDPQYVKIEIGKSSEKGSNNGQQN